MAKHRLSMRMARCIKANLKMAKNKDMALTNPNYNNILAITNKIKSMARALTLLKPQQ